MLFFTTTHTKPTTTQQENHQITTTHTTTTTTKKSKIKGLWVDQNHIENQNHIERERSVRGFMALGRRSVCDAKALGRRRSQRFVGRRSVCGFVDRRSRRRGGFVDQRSRSRRLSLSLSLFARESVNGLKWKFSIQTISGSKPSKHLVNWK